MNTCRLVVFCSCLLVVVSFSVLSFHVDTLAPVHDPLRKHAMVIWLCLGKQHRTKFYLSLFLFFFLLRPLPLSSCLCSCLFARRPSVFPLLFFTLVQLRVLYQAIISFLFKGYRNLLNIFCVTFTLCIGNLP